MNLENYELTDEEILKYVGEFREKFYELIVEFYKENLKNINNHFLSTLNIYFLVIFLKFLIGLRNLQNLYLKKCLIL